MGTEAMINLGNLGSFEAFPVSITIGNSQYYLVCSEGVYQLISRTCAHFGAIVFDDIDCFKCPLHGWKYDRITGKGITVPSSRLATVDVIVKDGQLWADLHENIVESMPTEYAELIPEGLKIDFHCHACFAFTFDGLSVITDPWINGPAMLGSWIQYPPPIVKTEDLAADVIIITHEHSDHLHEQTLRLMNRDIPVFVPDFPNQRMPKILEKLGFTNVTAMRFGDVYQVASRLKLTCFEPASYWNDSIFLLDLDGFRILNLNDAGLNQRLANRIGSVDVLATGFSSTASGYPITWNHLTVDQKKHFIKMDMEATILALQEKVKLYNPRILFPIASFFGLWHPSQSEYATLAKNISPQDIINAFNGTDVQVVDVLPGESWNVNTGEVTGNLKDRDRLFDHYYKIEHLQRVYDEQSFLQVHPPVKDLSVDQIKDYFWGLNSVPDMAMSEDVSVSVTVNRSDRANILVLFKIRDGALIIVDNDFYQTDIRIEIPEAVMGSIIFDNVSWDEAHIGYWCKFERDNDIYHAGFWRLLQAPYIPMHNEMSDLTNKSNNFISGHTVIADVIEKYGSLADRILRRYGLFCFGCEHSMQETIEQGAKAHGVDTSRIDRLITELNKALP